MFLSFSRYLLTKYAGFIGDRKSPIEGDSSLGAFINPDKVRVLKEKLSEAYDKLTVGITTLPAFIKINKELAGNPYLVELNELIEDFAEFVASNNLKECFTYTVRLIDALNELRDNIKNMPREKIFELENVIKSLQDTIWKEGKRILNIHDLRGLKLEFPEDVQDKFDKIVPTWDYGPGKNPAYSKIKLHRQEKPKDIIKRLMEENRKEELNKRK